MARIFTFISLAFGAVVQSSTTGLDTTILQPSHLPWAWNRTLPTANSSTSTNLPHTNSTLVVTVGALGELAFSPSSLNASIGSTVIFNFLALNHTLTQSNLIDPCLPNGGFDTGFRQFNPSNISGNNVVEFEVQTHDPQWFFCAQHTKVSHCHAGMIFSLNPGGNHSEFVQNARSTSVLNANPTLVCSQPSSRMPYNSFATGYSTGTVSATLKPSSTLVSPPIANTGNNKPAIGLGVLGSLYILFL
jgi:plastocyanin